MTTDQNEPVQTIDQARLRRLFEVFTGADEDGGSLVYAALTEAIVADDELLDLLIAAPTEQRRPSLLFAAVNLLLASNPELALAAYYPIHGGQRPVDDGLVPAFVAFCDDHRDELGQVLRERSTQTNEIRRCVALRAGLDLVQRQWPRPLALVEVGASAGLNLLADQYGYRLNGRLSNPGNTSPVVVSCEVTGVQGAELVEARALPFDRLRAHGEPVDRLLGPAPKITSRIGLDQHPIDLADPDARAWLEAFIWPEQTDELATLRGAIQLALATGIEVRAGDATTDIAALIAGLPGDEPVVIFTASLLSYLDAQGRTDFVAQLDEAAQDRRVAWVFAEAPGLLRLAGLEVAALNGPLAKRNDRYLVGTSLRCGDRDDQLLGLADPYLRWIAPARNDSDDFAWV